MDASEAIDMAFFIARTQRRLTIVTASDDPWELIFTLNSDKVQTGDTVVTDVDRKLEELDVLPPQSELLQVFGFFWRLFNMEQLQPTSSTQRYRRHNAPAK